VSVRKHITSNDLHSVERDYQPLRTFPTRLLCYTTNAYSHHAALFCNLGTRTLARRSRVQSFLDFVRSLEARVWICETELKVRRTADEKDRRGGTIAYRKQGQPNLAFPRRCLGMQLVPRCHKLVVACSAIVMKASFGGVHDHSPCERCFSNALGFANKPPTSPLLTLRQSSACHRRPHQHSL
jgi:hypothetical protein